MLGAVEVQRAPAQDREDEQDGERRCRPPVDQGPSAEREAHRGEHRGRGSASARAAVPRRSARTGASEAQRRTRPRASGRRWTSSGGCGIRPSRSEPSMPAKAQKRSLTITTPFGRAIPPSLGRRPLVCAPQQIELSPTETVVAQKGPPRVGGTAHFLRSGPRAVYQTPREKKPSSASTRMTIRTIQRIPMLSSTPFRYWRERAQPDSDTGSERAVRSRAARRSGRAARDIRPRPAGTARARATALPAASRSSPVCSAETNSITSTR